MSRCGIGIEGTTVGVCGRGRSVVVVKISFRDSGGLATGVAFITSQSLLEKVNLRFQFLA